MKPYNWKTAIVGTIIFLPATIFGKEVILDRPGTLHEHFSPDEVKNSTVILVKGNINQDDFQFLWSVPRLTELDLSETTVHETAGNPAHTIPASAFWGKKTLQRVKLPSSVTGISNYAFYGCSNLSQIGIPSGLASIGTGAFSLCDSLKTLTFSHCHALTRLNERAFSECSFLKQVTLPPNLKTIANRLFKDCIRLESVTIPDSITAIENGAFSHCTDLQTVNFPSKLKHIGNLAFEYCSALSEIDLPEGLETIGNIAFYNCTSLDSVTVPASVTGLEANAFRSCTSLTAITIQQGNPVYTSQDGIVYRDKGSTLYIYPAGKKGKYMLPSTVTRMQQAVFYNCPFLTAIVTTEENPTYRHIDGVLFSKDGKSLLNYPRGKKGVYRLPAQVIRIGPSAFSGSPFLTGILIPENSELQTIGNHAFYDCGQLTDLNLPAAAGLTEIMVSAFESCGSLPSVTFPANLRSLGNNAFYRCNRLDSIRFIGTIPPQCGNNIFTGISPECTITVPPNTGVFYKEPACFKDLYEITESGPAGTDTLSGSTITE